MKTYPKPIIMDLPEPPKIPSAQELYDLLMAAIEPELTSSQVPSLKQKYAQESKEERKRRMERYRKAYIAYREALDTYTAQLNTQAQAYRRAAFAYAEERDAHKEQLQLKELETAFSS
ncbi:MAG: hypothetical protein WCX29_02700 [Candidatus Peribacteraceae bacterium]